MNPQNTLACTLIPWLRPSLLACAVALLANTSQATEILAIKGQVQLARQQQAASAVVGTKIQEADTLLVPPGSEALVQFDDGAKMVVRSGSQLAFRKLAVDGEPSLREKTLQLIKGGLRYLSNKLRTNGSDRVSFETATSTVGIRGTDIEIAVTEDGLAGNPPGTYLKVNTGAAVLSGLDGTQVELAPGGLAFGPEPVTQSGTRSLVRPSARAMQTVPDSVFKTADLDSLLR
jgi:hypothetical protein